MRDRLDSGSCRVDSVGCRALRSAAGAVIAVAFLTLTWASAARAQTATLAASDFTMTLGRLDVSSGGYVALDDIGLATYFSAARCACPTNVAVSLSLSSTAAAQLASSDTLDATLMVGSDCDNVAATACPTVGSVLTMNASTTAADETVTTGAIFSPVQGSATCATLPATSTRLWAIVRLNGVRLGSQPSLAIAFGSAAPVAPTAVTLETADSGLLVSWTDVADTTRIQGYQVLCSPGPATPPDAAYETCPALTPVTGTGPFATLDPGFICSDLVKVGTTSVRVHGLQNGTTYQIAVIAIGNDGAPSAPSAAAQGSPGPTLGFDDVYKESGGTAPTGCALAGRDRTSGGDLSGVELTAAFIGMLLLRGRGRARSRPRRRRFMTRALLLPCACVGSLLWTWTWTRPARADDGEGFAGYAGDAGYAGYAGDDRSVLTGETAVPPPARSERRWNLQLGFGPYRPAIDSEFADRGQTARPFQEVFSSTKRLMSQLEIDRQLSHRGGTWALGVGAGYYRATARSLSADHLTRTGDDTALRLIPLSLSAVYRADVWHQRSGFPLVPYGKVGLDLTLWSITDSAKTSAMQGTTLGWHAAAGVSLDLAFLDPESAHTLEVESGVNQFALFFEVAHYAIDGLGASSALRVGDTTWLAGLMLEL